ncbi:MAG: DNA topoisomerase III, partial [Ruminococcaceae bacterium]|nr:DNA topoisomerase III [Oscillospiraceae bacterium]
CGENVVRDRYGYSCADKAKGCSFHVNNIILGKVITIENLKDLIETGKTKKISGFVSKRTGNKFDAYLKYVNGKVEFEF